MKKIISIALMLLSISVFAQRYEKISKNQPMDILNSKIGLIINVPENVDFRSVKSDVVNLLNSMGYKIVSVRRFGYFTFNNQNICNDFKENGVKYVMQYSVISGFHTINISHFSGDKNIVDYKNEATAVTEQEAQKLFNKLEKGISKVDPDNKAIKIDVQKLLESDHGDVGRIVKSYPLDLNKENLLIIENKGMNSGINNKKIKSIFEKYPYKYSMALYDSVESLKAKGQRYLLIAENDVSMYSKFVEENVWKRRDNFPNSSYEYLDKEFTFKSVIDIVYYPIIIDLQTHDIYYSDGVKGKYFPDVFKLFVEKVSK